MLVDAEDVLSHVERGHAVCVVRHTAQLCGRLACGERLPPRVCATRLRMKRGPVHEVSCAFFRAEEEDLRLCIKIDDLLLDVRCLAGDEENR